MALKEALAAAHAASQQLTEELRAAIGKVEHEVDERFAAMVAEWEAEVTRQAAAREAARRERCKAAASGLREQIRVAEGAPPLPRGASHESIAAATDGTRGGPRRGSLFANFRAAANPALAAAVATAGGMGKAR